MEHVSAMSFDAYRVDASTDPSPPPPPGQTALTWVRAPDLATAWPLLEATDSEELILELASYEGLGERLVGGNLAGKRLVRACVDTPDDCEALLTGAGDFEVMVALKRETAEYLLRCHPMASPHTSTHHLQA